MTQNEISYRTMLLQDERERTKLAETERTNRANEVIQQVRNAETERSNRAGEVIKHVQNAETERNNRAKEVIDQVRNAETARHNVADEEYDRAKLREDHRSNMSQEQLKREAQAETAMHNRATEVTDRAQAAARIMRYSGTTEGTASTNLGIFNAGAKITRPGMSYQEAILALTDPNFQATAHDHVAEQGMADSNTYAPPKATSAAEAGFTQDISTEPSDRSEYRTMLNPITGITALVDKQGNIVSYN